jgi:hypothetical protein
MRKTWPFLLILGAAAAFPVACGSGSESTFPAGDGAVAIDGTTGSDVGDGGGIVVGEGGTGQSDSGSGPAAPRIASLRIDPPTAVLDVPVGQQKSAVFKAFGKLDDGTEVDVTNRVVFQTTSYAGAGLPAANQDYLIGGFPADGAGTFTTRLPDPADPASPAQRGGFAVVKAYALRDALNPGETCSDVDPRCVGAAGSVTVRLTASTAGVGVPADPAALFAGPPSAARAPTLAYPNDGAVLPPNLRKLEVHFKPGNVLNTVYEVRFTSASADIAYYTRCTTNVTGGTLQGGSCALELDETLYTALAETNKGNAVTLTVRGTDDTATAVGTSAAFKISFAEEAVNGGVYYWDATNTRIMRFDFGGAVAAPEIFLAKNDYGTDGTCIGCHTVSRDGKKIVASLGGQNDGRQVYQADLTKVSNPPAPARTDVNYLTKKGMPITRFNLRPSIRHRPSLSRSMGIPGRSRTATSSGSTMRRPGTVQAPKISPLSRTIRIGPRMGTRSRSRTLEFTILPNAHAAAGSTFSASQTVPLATRRRCSRSPTERIDSIRTSFPTRRSFFTRK